VSGSGRAEARGRLLLIRGREEAYSQRAGMHKTLQEGIYFARCEKPPAFFTFLLLEPSSAEVTVQEAAGLLAKLWKLYAGLKDGAVPDLPGIEVPDGDLCVLLGLGARAFELPGRHADPAPVPRAQADFRFARPDQLGGRICDGAGIYYESHTNPADAAFAVQFTANTQLAVERAVVETWKLLHDEAPPKGKPALEIHAVYGGSQRDDLRSWLDFHDGISNIADDEREGVIMIRRPSPAGAEPDPDAWTYGGSYLAFMRLYIDLEKWRAQGATKQAALVGRDKLTGCPLIDDNDAFPGCTPSKPLKDASPAVLEKGHALSEAIDLSHIQRARHHIGPHGAAAHTAAAAAVKERRIFRQGYPFLETLESCPGHRVGTNFVSFQWSPGVVTEILGVDSWLGRTNFGGDSEGSDSQVSFVKARAAGFFLVPPRKPPTGTERFPGERALTLAAGDLVPA